MAALYPPIPVNAFTTRASQNVQELRNTITVSEAFDPAASRHAPLAYSYIAIWDTGSTHSSISKKVVEELGLRASGAGTIFTAGPSGKEHSYVAPLYLVNFILPNNIVIAGVKVDEGSTGGTEDVLLGMDVIGAGDFAITHNKGKTTWSFRYPHCDEIDFVPSANEHNRKLKNQSPGA